MALGLGDVGGFEIFLETELAGLRSYVGGDTEGRAKGESQV